MTPVRQVSRATGLLKKLVATGTIDRNMLASDLVMSEAQLESYLNEPVRLSLDRQLCLAQFVIERVPTLAREGRLLRAQVHAALAFSAGATELHAHPPPMRFR